MKANKRTVWFLTLISLVAVIAIFYMNNNPKPFDGMALFSGGKPVVPVNDNAEGTDKQTPVFAESFVFDEMRMTLRNARSVLNGQLTKKVGSTDFTSEEKSKALDDMAALTKQATMEELMEMQIIALGYPDAFVKTENEQVNVTVLTLDSQSDQQADEIIHLVKSTWEDARVTVKFDPGS